MRTKGPTLACLSAVLFAFASTVTGCAPAPVEAEVPTVRLRFATGPVGGGFYAFGEALVTALLENDPNLRIERPTSRDALSNLEAIQRGDTDLAFAFADLAYLAANGQLDPDTRSFDRVRGLAVVQLTPVQLVARLPVRTVTDLRGMRVSLGPENSGTALTARLVLGAFGLSPTDIRADFLEFEEAGKRLRDGTLDAMFDNAQYAEAIAVSLRHGADLVPIQGPRINHLREEYPFLREMTLPAGTYTGMRSIATVGVDSLVVCRQDLDEMIVHNFMRSLFAALSRLSRERRWNLADLTDSPATSVRLHDGAARYYREQELVR